MQCSCAILSSMAWPAIQCFCIFSQKRHNFRKKITEYKRYIFIFSTTLSEMILIRRQLNEIWWRMFIGLHVKYPLFLSDCNETLTYSKETSWLHRASNNVETFYYQLMHIMLKNTELLKHSKITLQHVSIYIETIFRELKSVLG